MNETIEWKGRQYLFARDYQEDDGLRRSMGMLCREIWGFDFEKMYQKDAWGVSFHPYTIFEGTRAISHISVTEMDFLLDGEVLHLVQLGTVMTAESSRGQGLSRYLLERILEDFRDCDAMFLFANESVLDFYPKFGFEPADEFPRTVREDVLTCLKKDAGQAIKAERFCVPASDEAEEMLLSLSENCKNGCGFYPVNHRFLVRFYLNLLDTFSIADSLYLLQDKKTVVFADLSKDRVVIRDIFSDGTGTSCLKDIIGELITSQTDCVEIRLAYQEPYLDVRKEAGADDLWLYARGAKAELLKNGQIIFPMTTHT